jgi:hypothetical protein
VEAEPATATVSCEAAKSNVSGNSYEVSLENSARDDWSSGSVLHLKVDWTGGYPGTQMCSAEIALVDGSKIAHPFTLDAPDGAVFPLHIDDLDPNDIASTSVTCGPYTGQEVGL